MLLKRLIEVQGASGNEEKIRQLIIREIKKYVTDVHIDKFGNVIAYKKGKGPRVMLAAHMDEIALMVKSIASNGRIRCSEIGGVDAMELIGQRVRIKSSKGPVHGIVTLPEISDDANIEDVPEIKHLLIDTGLTKKDLAKKGVHIGSFVEFQEKPSFLGSKDIILGKALDDRIGCYILLELAKKLQKTKLEIYFVFTVQEEMGLYGAKTSVYSLDPDWAVVVDVTNANDSKGTAHEITKQLGKGPVITIKDADMISNICIDDWLRKLAKKKKIPIQLEVSDVGTTDALSISISKGGIPTTSVGVAVRNLHTTFSIANMKDIKNAIMLLTVLLKNPPIQCLFLPKSKRVKRASS